MTRLTEGPTKKHNTTIKAGNEENSKHMSSIPDRGRLPTVLRAGACRARPTSEAQGREGEPGDQRQSWKLKLPFLAIHLC